MIQTAETGAGYNWSPGYELGNITAESIWKLTEALLVNPDFYDVVEETPLLTVEQAALPSDLQDSGYVLIVKHEGMQPVEAYKLRGATSALLGHRGPVVAASTGNHAAAVAYAAQRLGTGQVDVMCPAGTSQAKLAAIRRFGATAHPDYDSLPTAMHAAKQAGLRPGTLFVHAYDDESVIAGQGTIGVEIADQLRALGLADGAVTVHAPGGGGGLASGTAVGLSRCLPHAELYVNQSRGAEGILAALEGRELRYFDAAVDGAAVSQPGDLAMQIIRDPSYVTGVRSYTDGEVGEAMAVLGRVHKVPEPAGALGMAGALQYMRDHPRDPADQTPHVIVAITSGTVVTPEKVREFMGAALDEGTLSAPDATATYSQAYGERTISGVAEVLQRPLGTTALGPPNLLSGPTAGRR